MIPEFWGVHPKFPPGGGVCSEHPLYSSQWDGSLGGIPAELSQRRFALGSASGRAVFQRLGLKLAQFSLLFSVL